jgi:YD repeat-containing protein
VKTVCHRRRAGFVNPVARRTNFVNAAGTAVGYNYDPIGQLKAATSTTSSENRGYLYDAAWNLNILTNNGTTKTYSVDGKNQLTTVDFRLASYIFAVKNGGKIVCPKLAGRCGSDALPNSN